MKIAFAFFSVAAAAMTTVNAATIENATDSAMHATKFMNTSVSTRRLDDTWTLNGDKGPYCQSYMTPARESPTGWDIWYVFCV